MKMRLCDFIRKISGEFIVRIYHNDEEVIKSGTIKELKAEADASFDVLDGFSDALWEMPVSNFIIKDMSIAIKVNTEEKSE